MNELHGMATNKSLTPLFKELEIRLLLVFVNKYRYGS